MNDDDFARYNAHFDILHYSQKNTNDIGKIAPAYIREPKWEECFAMAFLQRFDEYKDIDLHDIQLKDKNSMDLYCKSTDIGIEVTQAINDAFREEESKWNKPLCRGISNDTTHFWENQPTSFSRIKCAICKKMLKYDEYIKKYHPLNIDLFIYDVDARIIESKQRYLKGFSVPSNMGYSPYEDLGFGFQDLLSEMKNPYRRTFIIFDNYWYKYENKHIQNCIMSDEMLKELFRETAKIQEKKGEELLNRYRCMTNNELKKD